MTKYWKIKAKNNIYINEFKKSRNVFKNLYDCATTAAATGAKLYIKKKKKKNAQPSAPQENVAPPQDNVAPSQENVAPPQENVAPPQENVAPPPENVAPPQENVAPPPENVAPSPPKPKAKAIAEAFPPFPPKPKAEARAEAPRADNDEFMSVLSSLMTQGHNYENAFIEAGRITAAPRLRTPPPPRARAASPPRAKANDNEFMSVLSSLMTQGYSYDDAYIEAHRITTPRENVGGKKTKKKFSKKNKKSVVKKNKKSVVKKNKKSVVKKNKKNKSK